MDLLQLQYFLRLATNEHVSKTAEQLHISQPSLSATIKKLETELGVPLFIRKGRNIALSPYGQAYKAYVEEAFLALDNGRQAIDRLRNADDCTLNLGLLSPYVWTEVFQDFAHLHPEVRINRYSVEGYRYVDQILAGKIDLYLGGINRVDALDDSKVQYTTLYEDDMVLLVHKSHPLAGASGVDLRNCREEHFINLDASTNLQQFISALFTQARYTPSVVMVCDYTLRDQMVAENHGVSITTKLAAQKTEARDVTYVPITWPAEKRRLGLVWRRGRVFSQSMQKFHDVACEFYRDIHKNI
jgi:DNA-binding transcriptional LysR family regulator